VKDPNRNKRKMNPIRAAIRFIVYEGSLSKGAATRGALSDVSFALLLNLSLRGRTVYRESGGRGVA